MFTMLYLEDQLQAVMILACERHVAEMLRKVEENPIGNWVVMPVAGQGRLGYLPHVSTAHSGRSCAIMGFGERAAIAEALASLAQVNGDGSLCCDCIAYEWSITQSHIAPTLRDPVCGKRVNCDGSFVVKHQGELFCFCSLGCRDTFERNPDSYVPAETEGRLVSG